MKLLSLFGALLLCVCIWFPLEAAGQRNVLLIWVDQLQHNVGSFAGGPAQTPNLDKLAATSTHFRTACTTTALCSPMRAAMYTGRWGHRTGVDDNVAVWYTSVTGLPLDQKGLIEWAREAGYFTGYFGKWHLGADGPIKRGVHRFQAGGYERNRAYGEEPDWNRTAPYYEKGRQFQEKPGFYQTVKGTYEDTHVHTLAQQADAFLQEAAAMPLPFFLTVSFPEPHPPYNVPAPYNTMYDPAGIVLPANYGDTFEGKPDYQRDILHPFHDVDHLSREDWQRCIAYYRGFVTMLDRGIGAVLDALDRHGLDDNTLVVLVSDHGDMAGAHRQYDKGPYLYDEILRVPLLLRLPGVAHRDVRRHVSNMDVTATMLDWMELPPSWAPDSRSLLPLAREGDKAWGDAPDEVFSRYEKYNGRWYGIRSIRTKSLKYNWNPTDIDELYDLEKDPGELHNLINDPAYRKDRTRLKTHILQHMEQTNDPLADLLRSRLRSE